MPTSARLRFVFALAAAIALPAIACKSAAERAREKAEEKAIEQKTGGQVKVDEKKGTLTIVTDAGAMTLGTGTSIPADFPKTVPLYPGATPGFAAKSTDPHGKDVWSLQLETGDAKDKVIAYYKANLSGFTLATNLDMGESSMQVWQSPTLDVTLIIASESDAKTSITENVASK
jgi:hypothetical protein